ncbi:MAG: NAD-binding protein [Vicinamibacteria bacterium]|jgi:voltage-gated potassium channel Kch|nr:NAD-binding protein [Vicinamibacteria bacterium]
MTPKDFPAPSLGDRVRYTFDNLMARGTPALIGLLGIGTLLAIVSWAAVVSIFGLLPDEMASAGFLERMWFGLMRTLDAGTMGGDAGGWAFLVANLGITLGGVFIVSALIGVLNNGLEARLDGLRKGRSKVIESDHTVILGWGPAVFTIIEELATANENKRDACIVILSETDKVTMEDAVRERVPDTKTTRVVCRSGSTTDIIDLAMVSVQSSRSIMVISPEDGDPDVHVIKTLLAIIHAPDRRKAPYHIVAELRHERNLGIAKMVGKHEAEIISASDLISRITVQTCRQSGLSLVHTELLDFGGDEIYFADAKSVVGQTFGDALNRYATSSIIGVATPQGPLILPDLSRRIEPTDRLIAISADDDTVVPSKEVLAIDESAIAAPERARPRPERTLILGANERLLSIVNGLDAYVAPGSEVVVVAAADDQDLVTSLEATLKNQALHCRKADITDRKVLDSLEVGRFDHLIVLSDNELSAEMSDSRVLVTLLHLREIGEKLGQDLAIVSDMRDVRNRRLAEVTDADDFIVSDRLVSLMMCQVAENKDLFAVLSDLFDPEGAEIYLKPASDYILPGIEVSFATVVESARRRGEIAIGYRKASLARDSSASYGVRTNPPKTERATFGPDDKVIVIAEN